MPGFAPMEFSVKVVGTDPGEIIHERQAVTASASSADSNGGIKRGQNGCEFSSQAKAAGTWTIEIDFKAGDELTVDAYEDLSEIGNIAPGLAIICGITGLVLFLRGRAASATHSA